MRILTRYMLRAHVGPFLFALSVLTGLLFVNVVARRLPELAGKGLPTSIFLKVMVLSLPHIIALTLPMAVLVAVLYAYSQLAADNEVTALKASGVNMLRLLVPILIAGTVLAGGMVWFNDRILPETNHQLKNLMANIATKSPTLSLQEQVVNGIRTENYETRIFLRPGRVDHASGRMQAVTIYDMSDPQYRRTIYADSGHLGFNQDTTDLFLTLYDGYMLTVDERQPGGFERVRFAEQRSVLRGVGSKWNADASDEYRSDREMSLAMLAAYMDSTRLELRAAQKQLRRQAVSTVDIALRGPLPVPVPPSAGPPSGYPMPAPDAAGYYGASVEGDAATSQAAVELRALSNRIDSLRNRVNQYQVEYHKKFAIPFACIIFVLIGAPLAVRFPRGGAGMVIAISLAIFGIYYMSLIGGESLGDDGKISPLVGPWAPNFIFGLIALYALTRIGKETSTTRGGDWEDLWRTIVVFVTAPFRRKHRRALAARAGGAD